MYESRECADFLNAIFIFSIQKQKYGIIKDIMFHSNYFFHFLNAF